MKEQTGALRITKEDGTEVFTFDPATDPVLGENFRSYRGAILSCPQFHVGDAYLVFAGDTQMAYTGTDVMMGPGGFRPGMGIPEDREDMPEPPEGDVTLPPQPSEGMDPVPQGTPPTGPQGEPPAGPQGGPPQGQPQTVFVMQDQVNFFSGLIPAE